MPRQELIRWIALGNLEAAEHKRQQTRQKHKSLGKSKGKSVGRSVVR